MNVKKILLVFLATVLTASMGSVAVAADTEGITEIGGTETHKVMGNYNRENENPGAVYSVDIEWGSLNFNYNAKTAKVWNPNTHEYIVKEEAGTWVPAEAGADKIKVTNHSNAPVTVMFVYNDNGSGINGTFDKAQISIPTAENTTVEKAPSETATLSVSGEWGDTQETRKVIGEVAVTVSGVQEEKKELQ